MSYLARTMSIRWIVMVLAFFFRVSQKVVKWRRKHTDGRAPAGVNCSQQRDYPIILSSLCRRKEPCVVCLFFTHKMASE